MLLSPIIGLGTGTQKPPFINKKGFVKDGLLLNGVFSSDYTNPCVTFDGSNDYLQNTNAAYFDINSTASFTYGFWAFLTNQPDGGAVPNYPALFGNADTNYNRNIDVMFNNVANQWIIAAHKQSNGTMKYVSFQGATGFNKWYFCVARYTYTGDLATSTYETIVYDEFGNLLSSNTVTGRFDDTIEPSSASNRFRLGYHVFNAGYYSTEGTCMRDLWLYDRAITDNEISEILNGGLGKTYNQLQTSTKANCRYWFPLTEPSNATRFDAVASVPLSSFNFVRQSAYWVDFEGTKRRYTMFGNSYLTAKGGFLNGNDCGISVVRDAITDGINGQSYTIEMFVRIVESGTYDILWSNDFTSHSPPYYTQHLRHNYSVGNSTLSYITDNNVVRLLNPANPNNILCQIVITCEDTAGTKDLRMYLRRLSDNAVIYNSTTTAAFTHTYYNRPVWIGTGNFNGELNGEVQGFRYYNRALSLTEIDKNYNYQKEVN